MRSLRYLLLGVSSAGLLGPLAVAWSLGRLTWRRGLVSLGLALPLWVLAWGQPHLWSALLWFGGLLALNAWAAGGLRQVWGWLFAAGLLLGHTGLALGVALALLHPLFETRQGLVLALGAGLALAGLLGLELLFRWRAGRG